jgi:hypothetical protein
LRGEKVQDVHTQPAEEMQTTDEHQHPAFRRFLFGDKRGISAEDQALFGEELATEEVGCSGHFAGNRLWIYDLAASHAIHQQWKDHAFDHLVPEGHRHVYDPGC